MNLALNRQRRLVTTAAIFLAFLLSACATPSSRTGSGSASNEVTQEPKVASLPQWDLEGQRLQALKKSAAARAAGEQSDWVYQSLPISVLRDGEYTLVFNVDMDFSLDPPAAIAYDFPSDLGFVMRPKGAATLTPSVKGQVLKQVFVVTGVNVSNVYPQFTAWIY